MPRICCDADVRRNDRYVLTPAELAPTGHGRLLIPAHLRIYSPDVPLFPYRFYLTEPAKASGLIRPIAKVLEK